MSTRNPGPRFRDSQIEMAHGAGGTAGRRLLEGLIAPLLIAGDRPLDDAAILDTSGQIAFTSDGFVVNPLLFPGGSIGDLAVNGTVNDLAVSAARPLALLITLIVEAGLPSEVLTRELRALRAAADRAEVQILGGDTKVVEHGKADGLFIASAGIGMRDTRVSLGPGEVRPGDRVVVSGSIGDHGITILLARGELDLEADLASDTRSVWPLVHALIEQMPAGLRWLRDPTRGGVASALNELARDTDLGIELAEEALPVRPEVRGACEILGLDPLHIANEGKFIAIVTEETAERTVEILRSIDGGSGACVIGRVTNEHRRRVIARTPYGGSRVVDMLVGDPLPRIC